MITIAKLSNGEREIIFQNVAYEMIYYNLFIILIVWYNIYLIESNEDSLLSFFEIHFTLSLIFIEKSLKV